MEEKNVSHNLIIEQCKRINMSGVKEVKNFDEETVILETVRGILTIKGEELQINSFSASTGELFMEGNIWAAVYSGNDQSKGFLRRILK
ncbi:MAG: sporulation protein YabP [Acutalibacteraceae bacterium]|nr:sporulation protein YabP [Acutalibacteraceae bacterium]